MKVAIIGSPGAGKTTLAAAVAAEFGLEVLTAGDIARRYDPGSIERGDMADPIIIKRGVEKFIASNDGWVLDGYPRTPDQMLTLQADVEVILLNVERSIAVERLRKRGREDDTPELTTKKIDEQTRLMELDIPNGWAYTFAGWRRSVNTSRKRPWEISRDVVAYLRGEKHEVY